MNKLVYSKKVLFCLGITLVIVLAAVLAAAHPAIAHPKTAASGQSLSSAETTPPPVTGVTAVWNETNHTITVSWDPYPEPGAVLHIGQYASTSINFLDNCASSWVHSHVVAPTATSIEVTVPGGSVYEVGVGSRRIHADLYSQTTSVSVATTVSTRTTIRTPINVRRNHWKSIAGNVWVDPDSWPARGFRKAKIVPRFWDSRRRRWVNVNQKPIYATVSYNAPPWYHWSQMLGGKAKFYFPWKTTKKGRYCFAVQFLGDPGLRPSSTQSRPFIVR